MPDSFHSSISYFNKLIKKATRSFPECVPPEDQKYEIREIETICTHTEVLEKFQEMAEYLGENGLDYMRKYPEIVELLIDIFKNVGGVVQCEIAGVYTLVGALH